MRAFWIRFGALLKKELILLLKNPKSRLTLFLPPVAQLLVLSYAATMELREMDFAILDCSASAASRELIARFSRSGVFRRREDLRSEQEMKERISRREIRMALVIPEKLEREIRTGGAPEVQVIVDGRNSSSAGLALGYARSILESFRADRSPSSPPFRIESRAWFNPNYNARYFMVPALLATIALLDLMLLAALGMAREREEGTFDQLLLTPYSSGELLLAKGISTFAVGLCQLTVGLLLALFWFRIPLAGSVWLVYLLFAAFMFAAIGLGLLISVLSRDLNQAIIGAFLVMIPYGMLSGLATPIESMPDILQKITLLNPLRYGIRALQEIFLEGAGMAEMLPALGILCLIGCGAGGAALILFQHQRMS